LIYLDTSFVVSLYTQDANSPAAANIIQHAQDALLISSLVELETVNALQLRVFRKEISASQADASLRNFELDVRTGVYQLRPLTDSIVDHARALSRQLSARLGTRSADVLHVAAALEFGANGFFSFDQQQRKMAQASGLKLSPIPRRP
jgi:predicted nucleic acid-binding protein